MIKDLSLYFKTLKSPILLIGFFCLLCLVSGCRRETDPTDVTIMFWTALSENNWERAKKYSVEGSVPLFNKKTRNIYLQTGTVVINYDKASVETTISRAIATGGLSFKTYLVRIKQNDIWKVDYPRTVGEIKDKKFTAILEVFKKIGLDAKTKVKEKIPWVKDKIAIVKNWFKKRVKKLVN